MKVRFSPGQIVTMVLAVSTAAVLTPVSVNAATGSNVVITDKLNATSQARVGGKGGLYGTEIDPVSGALGKVNADGSRPVSGTVTTVQGNPTQLLDTINDLTLSASDTRRPMFSGVGGRKTSVTSLIVSGEGGTAGSIKLLVIAYVKSNSTSGDCETLSGFAAAERFTVLVPVGQTLNLTWPTGLVWTQYADANDFYCVNVESNGGPTGYTAHVAAFGFRS